MRNIGDIMRFEDPHISDQDLLLFVDGEIQPKGKAAVETHLEACWECRTRLLELQKTIADFVHAHHAQFDSSLPPIDGPLAILRAQIQQINARPKKSLFHAWRDASMVARTWSAATVICTLVATMALLVVVQRNWQAGTGPTDARIPEISRPRRNLTPGETVSATKEDVCAADFPTENTIAPPRSMKRRVFERYGMPNARSEDFEVDYLITPDLGGAMTIRNLWPQPYHNTDWNARIKDQLEKRLRSLVCSGQINLATAQQEMASDWITAYKRYFHVNSPVNTSRTLAAPQPMVILAARLYDYAIGTIEKTKGRPALPQLSGDD
jgi:hypothetical protein